MSPLRTLGGPTTLLLLLMISFLEVSSELQNSSLELCVETRLLHHIQRLSEIAGADARPVLDRADNVTVWFGMRLIRPQLNEEDNTIYVSAWVRHRWYNQYLTWNPDEWDGITKMRVPSDWLWIPDVTLVTTTSTHASLERSALVNLYSDGKIFWLVHQEFTSSCLVDLTDYPFDRHHCTLWFQSISWASSLVDLQPYVAESAGSAFDAETYLTDFQEADEWALTLNTSKRVRTPSDEGVTLVFSGRVSLKFTLGLRRQVGFLAYLATVPCVVFGALALLIHVLPPERPDRNALGTSLLASFLLTSLLLNSVAPASPASIPRIGILYGLNMSMVVVSLFLSSFTVSIYRRSLAKHPFPSYLYKLTTILAKIFLVSSSIKDTSKKTDVQRSKELFDNDEYTKGQPPTSGSALEDVLVDLTSATRELTSHLTSRDEASHTSSGQMWKTLASAVDRIFLVSHLILFVCFCVLYFPRTG